MAVSDSRKAELRAESRAKGRDIGPIPEVENPKRRKRCGKDLLRAATTYFPQRFPLAFSDDHKRMVRLLQSAILDGGQFAIAMPRGSGKTTICEVACLWAILYGHRKFLFLIAADAAAAEAICANIRAELDGNDLLAADFPDACHAIRALEGISRRAEGQTSEGERTMLVWTKNEVRLPRTAAGGGSVMRTAGITGRIRGAKAVLADGTQPRPDLVLIDDPQTDESANSVSQTATRMRVLSGSVMGLAGPGKRIAALCTCTVIAKDDLADQLLDRKAHPEWQGVKARLMHAMPSDQKRWDAYAEILREDMRLEVGMARATAYYREHRAEMDAGAHPSWPQRYSPGELSATQHAMNLMITRGLPAFQAEYQNDPSDPFTSGAVEQVTPPAILRKLNQHDRLMIPVESTILTAGVDVQGSALYWTAIAWSPGFAGDIVGYGTYPDQGRPYFTVSEIERTMVKTHPGASWEASLYASLEALMEYLCGREWTRDDGGLLRMDQVVIDAGYGDSTKTIYPFCRRSKFSGNILPYFGRKIAAGAPAMDEWKRKPGDRIGPGWRIARPSSGQTKHIIADANRWKSFVADRLLTPAGAGGSLAVYGSHPSEHRMLADQLSAETRTQVTANGRTAAEWRVKPNRDNHLLDCCSMAAIAASVRGMQLDPTAAQGRIGATSAAPGTPAPDTRPMSSQPPPTTTPTAPRPGRSGPRRGGFLAGFGFGG